MEGSWRRRETEGQARQSSSNLPSKTAAGSSHLVVQEVRLVLALALPQGGPCLEEKKRGE
jgi:hypothetical protein